MSYSGDSDYGSSDVSRRIMHDLILLMVTVLVLTLALYDDLSFFGGAVYSSTLRPTDAGQLALLVVLLILPFALSIPWALRAPKTGFLLVAYLGLKYDRVRRHLEWGAKLLESGVILMCVSYIVLIFYATSQGSYGLVTNAVKYMDMSESLLGLLLLMLGFLYLGNAYSELGREMGIPVGGSLISVGALIAFILYLYYTAGIYLGGLPINSAALLVGDVGFLIILIGILLMIIALRKPGEVF